MRRLTSLESVREFFEAYPGATAEDLAEYMGLRRLTLEEAIREFCEAWPGATAEDLAEHMNLMWRMIFITLDRAVTEEEILWYITICGWLSLARAGGRDEPSVPARD